MLPSLLSLSFLAVLGFFSASQAADLEGRLYVDGIKNGSMQAGQKSRWQFEFIDKETGQSPHHFHEMHQKPMHLIVVSQDFSSFAHIHPYHRPHARKAFYVDINSSSDDFDNQQLSHAVSKGGTYFVYGEVMPMGYDMLLFPFTVLARGSSPPLQEIETDPINQNGEIQKYFDIHGNSVEMLNPEARYQISLKLEVLDHCGTVLPKLNLLLSFREEGQSFGPLTDLETWLGSFGHALVLGVKGETAEQKIAQHLHAVWPLPVDDPSQADRGPYLELAAHSHGQSTPADRYRAWVQIKHRGKLLTLPFTFDWNVSQARGNSIGVHCLKK